MLIWALLPTKSFLRTLLNHFISKAVHDLFSFQCEVLPNGLCLRKVRFCYFLPNLLLRMRSNGHSCPRLNIVQKLSFFVWKLSATKL